MNKLQRLFPAILLLGIGGGCKMRSSELASTSSVETTPYIPTTLDSFFANSPGIEDVKNIVRTNKSIRSLNDLLKVLLADKRFEPINHQFAIIVNSHSAVEEAVTPFEPRLILYVGRLIMAITTKPSSEFYNVMEMMEYKYKEATFVVDHFDLAVPQEKFLTSTPAMDATNNCDDCHGAGIERRPIWESYNFWPSALNAFEDFSRSLGNYSSTSNEVRIDKGLCEGYSGVDSYKTQSRLKLFSEGFKVLCSNKQMENIYSPELSSLTAKNRALTDFMGRFQAHRMYMAFRYLEHYDAYKFAILGAWARCDIQPFISSNNHSTAKLKQIYNETLAIADREFQRKISDFFTFNGFGAKTSTKFKNADGKERELDNDDLGYAGIIAAWRYVLQDVPMAIPFESFAFSREPSGYSYNIQLTGQGQTAFYFEFLTNALEADVRRVLPNLPNRYDRKKTEIYCSSLASQSRTALAKISTP